MAFDSLRGYVQLASGLGELTRARAMEAAEGLMSIPGLGETGWVAGQASALGDELLSAARANHAGLLALVRQELESALGRAQVVRAADLEAARAVLNLLTVQVEELRRAVLGEGLVAGAATTARDATGVAGAAIVDELESLPVTAAAATHGSRRSTARRSTPGSADTGRSTAKKSTAKKSSSSAPTAKKSTAKKSTAKKSTAKKSTSSAPTAKKSTAKRSAAKKTS